MIRSRTKHIENEERPLKFFYAEEKQNQNKKNITKLKNKNGELKTRQRYTENSQRILLRSLQKSTNK